ncbi:MULTISPECIES: bifunctional lysylphosphatidylglycerol flippase/synthetase MprF [unclassified Enterococcus]|uniref:bifunctional lysylphosphatidylglycerol flippase/synthetase MprF n=1 Tax=unclassified Enterococcus TaxID=2608891 RepID=UPI0015525B4F|nr:MULTISPECIES: bifunctional lysylphosphatidylglycerol flippase/synthetase MprF [unclassified Enterococcus]MBS7578117.1 bifunctional lysylphosphatidylglycerol flippase/synthetase MprF [Enterococcus sp. MMGLQ5-2]MBS7585377.1 bifunctional lysylphosphatidylglycerol flippase/synthetase MprF [Enterococcus sp. MMGLQ5-1]NPD13234.1 bifunctional lysylphosphatidylglycerol flippase/synthetase MprF [Enterococcus sp. MMGLQ5-1]NPD37948.1 bifunctional lysylphosphatidylglycerol flippase/synthetase MprF [Enter
MKFLIQKIKEQFKLIKGLFFVTVVAVVIYESLAIIKTIQPDKLRHAFNQITPLEVIALILLGALAVLPMIYYDFIFNKELQTNFSKKYIAESSLLINTLNNLVGFGGLIGTSLRAHFYGKEKTPKDVLKALGKLLIFEISGLSILSAIALILAFTPWTNNYFYQYWPWLLGGTLYFPVILIVSFLAKDKALLSIPRRLKYELTLTSILEWLAVSCFFIFVGLTIGENFAISNLFVLYIAATIIGFVSLIPGGLGSFDIMMILGLQNIGISTEQAAVWLLIYRIGYYLIPVIIAVILFLKTSFNEINQHYDGLPKILISDFAHHASVFLLYTLGILMVLSAAIPVAFEKNHFLHQFSPWGAQTILTVPKLTVGFLLLIVAHSILVKVKRAFVPSLILLIGTLVYIIVKSSSLIPALNGNALFFSYYRSSMITGIIIGIAIVLIILSKKSLHRKQLVLSNELFFKDGLIFIVLSIAYILIGVYNHPNRHHHRPRVNFLLFPSEKLWLSGFLMMIIISVFMAILIHYLQGKKETIGQAFDNQKVQAVLEQFGGNQQSHLAFLKDKELFFYQAEGVNQAFLQFKQIQDKLIVMGDPSGNPAYFQKLIEDFVNQADILGYSPIFYEVTKNQTMFLHELGFRFFKMGEEGHVDLQSFSISGKKNRTKRSLVNQVEKAGFTMAIITPPFDRELMERLKAISDEWLAGREEKGFSLGFFSEDYCQRAPIAVVKGQNGQIEAFATIMPCYQEKRIISIDLMRYSKEAPKGVMDFLFISIFEHYQAEGYQYFDLGMAPLSNVGVSSKSYAFERIAHLIYQFGTKIYSFQGLRAYKDKYADFWVSRYTLYSRDKNVIFTILALLSADKR